MLGEELDERLIQCQEDRGWEPQEEACSAPGESSDYSDGPTVGRGRGGGEGVLRRRRRRPVWSRLEEEILARQHSIRGNSWSAIAEHLKGRTASEVKNIWHSTLRSKKLKSRSLLRAYAREVQERGDSAAARLEAFRIAFRQTRGNDEMEADATAAKASGNGRLHDPASPDDDIYGLHADMSPRHNPHFADSAEGTHVGKKALMKHSPSGSSEGADDGSLSSDPMSPHHRAFRSDPTRSRAYRTAAPHDARQLALQEGLDPEALTTGLTSQPTATRQRSLRQLDEQPIQELSGGGRLHSEGLRRPGVSAAAEATAAAMGRTRTGGARSIPMARPLMHPEHPAGLPLQQLLLMQQQQQQQQRYWPFMPMAHAPVAPPLRAPGLKREQQPDRSTGGRGLPSSGASRSRGDAGEEDDGDDEGGEDDDEAPRRKPRPGRSSAPPQPREDEGGFGGLCGLGGLGHDEMSRLHMMMMMQSAAECTPGCLQEAAAGAAAAAWMHPRRPSTLSQFQALAQMQAFAQMQALVQMQAQANIEAEEEARRIAMMRHYFALQMQQGRLMDPVSGSGAGGGSGGAAAGGAFGSTEEMAAGGSRTGRLMVETGAGGSAGRSGQQRDSSRGTTGYQGTARQSSARAASASAVAAGAVGEEFYGSERAQMTAVPVGYLSSLGPFAAATAAAVAAAATSGGRPGLDPYGLLAQQQMGGTLEPFSALMCGGGVMPRLLNPHAVAAAMAASRVAAADAAFVGDLDLAGRGMLGGMYPFLGPGAWPATAAAAHEGLEADGSGGGTGPSSADTLTGTDVKGPSTGGLAASRPEGPSRGAGGGSGGRHASLAPSATAEPRESRVAGTKRRAELRDEPGADRRVTADCGANRVGGPGTDRKSQGLLSRAIFPGASSLPFLGGMSARSPNAYSSLFGLYGRFGDGLPTWMPDDGGPEGYDAATAAALARDGLGMGGYRGAGPFGFGGAVDRVSVPGASGFSRDEVALQGDGGVRGGRPRRRRPPQRYEEEEVELQADEQEPLQHRSQRHQQRSGRMQSDMPQQQQQQRRRLQEPQQKDQQLQRSQQPQHQQDQQQQPGGKDQDGMEVDGSIADPSICDVARALISFSQQRPR